MRLLAKQVHSLSSHIPIVRSASCPGAAPGLSDFGDLSAQLVRNLSAVSKWCGQPVTLRLLSIGNAVSWLVDHDREKGKGAPGLDRFQCPGSLLMKLVSCGGTA